MTKLPTVLIGGEHYEVPPLNFKALKAVFPILKKLKLHTREEAEANPDMAIEALDATVEILAIALKRSPTPLSVEEIEEKLLASEIPGLQPALVEILAQNGLQATKPGEETGAEAAAAPEAEPAEEESRSTETSTQ